MKSMLAGLVAGAFIFSPVTVVVSTTAMAQDTPSAATGCADPASPGNRPGGYCEQAASGSKSLTDPQNSDSMECAPYLDGMLTDDFFQTLGARVEVAIQDPCNPH